MSRDQINLAVLGGLILIVAYMLFGQLAGGVSSAESADPGTGVARRGAGPAGTDADQPDRVVVLRLADLEAVPGAYSPGRDPFRFHVPKPPGPTAEELAERDKRRQEAASQRQVRQPPTPQGPRPPALDLKYLGRFGTEVRQIGVFTDATDIYNAMPGDVINQKFVVESLGYESADLGFVGFPDEPTKRLAAGG